MCEGLPSGKYLLRLPHIQEARIRISGKLSHPRTLESLPRPLSSVPPLLSRTIDSGSHDQGRAPTCVQGSWQLDCSTDISPLS